MVRTSFKNICVRDTVLPFQPRDVTLYWLWWLLLLTIPKSLWPNENNWCSIEFVCTVMQPGSTDVWKIHLAMFQGRFGKLKVPLQVLSNIDKLHSIPLVSLQKNSTSLLILKVSHLLDQCFLYLPVGPRIWQHVWLDYCSSADRDEDFLWPCSTLGATEGFC